MLAAGAGAAVALDHWSGALSALGGSASHSRHVGHGGTGRGAASTTASAIAAKVDPGIVDVASTLANSTDISTGTGMVISSSGLVLTNEHVIDQATSVSAIQVSSGRFYNARVVGYDSTHDVALLQLVGASGLKTVTLSDSSKAKVGEVVFALGDAGDPGNPLMTTAKGTITALDQIVRVGDSDASAKLMHGMIESNTHLRHGDSGGPLVNGDGAVIGMDTAGSFPGQDPGPTSSTGSAIPINTALSIAGQIRSGKASPTVHLGLAAYLGVNTADGSSPHPCASGSDGPGSAVSSPASSGALICAADSSAPASEGGLKTGDVIVSVNGKAIGSAGDLTAVTAAARPGDTFAVDYVDRDGARHSTTVTLTGWVKPLSGQPFV